MVGSRLETNPNLFIPGAGAAAKYCGSSTQVLTQLMNLELYKPLERDRSRSRIIIPSRRPDPPQHDVAPQHC
jgi:hypothetical protein